MKRRWLAGFLGVWGAALVLAAPALGWGGVDLSFGHGGVIRVDPKLPGYEIQEVEQIGVGPGGGIYLLNAAANCFSTECSRDLYLTRRKPNGFRDGEYAGGHGAQLVSSRSIRQPGRQPGDLAVDRLGRAIVAAPQADGTLLVRLNPDGSFDSTFGDGGRLVIPCPCGNPMLRIDRAGRIYLALSQTEYLQGSPGRFSTQLKLAVARLDPDGSLDSRGWSETTVDEAVDPDLFVVHRDGSMVFGGQYRCCQTPEEMFLLRIGPRGGIDRSFRARFQAELRKLDLSDSLGSIWPRSMLARAGGAVDIFGSGREKGLVLRVRRNGSFAPRFGRNGLRPLPLQVTTAARFKDGRVFVVGRRFLREGLFAFSLNANGSFDRSFDQDGPIYLPTGENSASVLAMQRGVRPLLFDSGEQFCRGYCPPEPRLMRFRSPWDRGR